MIMVAIWLHSERPQMSINGKRGTKLKVLSLFEGTAVKVVEGCHLRGSVIGNEKACETIEVSIAGKYLNLLKIRAHRKNPQSAYTTIATEIKFHV